MNKEDPKFVGSFGLIQLIIRPTQTSWLLCYSDLWPEGTGKQKKKIQSHDQQYSALGSWTQASSSQAIKSCKLVVASGCGYLVWTIVPHLHNWDCLQVAKSRTYISNQKWSGTWKASAASCFLPQTVVWHQLCEAAAVRSEEQPAWLLLILSLSAAHQENGKEGRVPAQPPTKSIPVDGSEASIRLTSVEWDQERGQLEYINGTEREDIWKKKIQVVTVNQKQWLR